MSFRLGPIVIEINEHRVVLSSVISIALITLYGVSLLLEFGR